MRVSAVNTGILVGNCVPTHLSPASWPLHLEKPELSRTLSHRKGTHLVLKSGQDGE